MAVVVVVVVVVVAVDAVGKEGHSALLQYAGDVQTKAFDGSGGVPVVEFVDTDWDAGTGD